MSMFSRLFGRGERTITRNELAEAIRKNGLVHVRGAYFTFSKDGACALGQAIYNLYGTTNYMNGKESLFLDALEMVPEYNIACKCSVFINPKDFIIHLNDAHYFSLDRIADDLKAGPDFKVVVH